MTFSERIREMLRRLGGLLKGSRDKSYRNPRRFRLIFVNDRTFNSVWTIHMTTLRVVVASAVLVFALASLVYIILAYTPAKAILPGYLKKSERRDYMAESERVDSLVAEATVQKMYVDNIIAILNDEVDTDSLRMVVTLPDEPLSPDSLAGASQREQEFVRQYRDRERFNLSVLAPIAAEGMVFMVPTDMQLAVESANANSLQFKAQRQTGVSSIYRGTVVASYFVPLEGYTVVIQHPNDFLSVYSGLDDVFVAPGDKLSTGSRIGVWGGDPALQRPLSVDLWHNGSRLDPAPYLLHN